MTAHASPGKITLVGLGPANLVEPLQQVHQSRLAGTGRSDDRDRLAGQRLHVQALDQRVVR